MESDEEEYVYESGEEYTYEDGDDGGYDEDDSGMIVSDSKSEKKAETISRRSDRLEISVPDGKVVITEYSAVVPLLETLVSEVSALLHLDVDATQVLLQHFRWNKEKLINQFFVSPEKILFDAGLDLYDSTILESARESCPLHRFISPGQTTFSCRICCDDACDIKEAFSLGCGHLFCRPCYREYLRNQITDGPSCILAHCPQHKCKQAITRSLIALFLDGATASKYNIYVTRNFIETSKTMKYCPAAGCDKVAVGSGVTSVRCNCSNFFCFKCGEEAHDPCSCAQLAEWAQKCQNESETANWILANTKKCPICNARIEKNQGCNHMNCKLCKHEFCWICMGPWQEHGQNTGGYYKCNRYDPAKVEGGSAAQKAKAELDRYLHYYQRYHGHDQSLKYASAQREAAERRMIERQESQRSTWIDVQFLKQAAEQVIDCRRVLKYTYVMGYFLKDESPEKQLYEHHQEMLEKNTERLQESTENLPLEALDRTQVVNMTRVTDRFMTSLLASMQGGVVELPDDGAGGGIGAGGSAMALSGSGSSSDLLGLGMASKRDGGDEDETAGGKAGGAGGGAGGGGGAAVSGSKASGKGTKSKTSKAAKGAK